MKLSDDERVLLEKIVNELMEEDQTKTRTHNDELYDIETIDEKIADLQKEIVRLEDIRQQYVESFNKRKLTIRVFQNALESIE